MSSEDRVSDGERSTEESAVSTESAGDGDSARTNDSTVIEPSAGPGGGPPADREASKWGGYALAGLLAAVFLVGLLRLVYPTSTGLLIGGILALFGVLVALFAVRERLGGS